MEKVSPKIIEYVEAKVLPRYSTRPGDHEVGHIHYVIRRSLKFAEGFPEVNMNMAYVIAAYHDIARSYAKEDPVTGKDDHHILGAQEFLRDERIKEFFSEEERRIIAEAIEDHRASAKNLPRTVYGKIVSTADRRTSVDDAMRATYGHRRYKLKSKQSDEEIREEAKRHLANKYGEEGYAKDKTFLPDVEYEEFLAELRALLKDEESFDKRFAEVVKGMNP